jgi:aminoglycoside phosphotransferase (APT) family kinase protein
MREGWGRNEPEIRLDRAAIESLVAAAFPAARIEYCKSARGGLTNTNIEVGLSAPPSRVNLRLYQGSPKDAGKEVALNALLLRRGLPTARFLYFAKTNPVTGEPYAILEWVEGARLASIGHGLDEKSQRALGMRLGAVLAGIHAILFETAGYLDAELCVEAPIDFHREAVIAFLRSCLDSGVLSQRLGPDLASALVSFVEREGCRLDAWLGKAGLVHADFNASNILVRRGEDHGWRIAAVLDWEFAFAGSPAFDFGNLLRPPLGHKQAFIAAVARAYQDAGGVLPDDWRDAAKIADLIAWADVLRRDIVTPALIADAAFVIRRTISSPR